MGVASESGEVASCDCFGCLFFQCSADCGRGQRTREVVCMNVENKTIAENKCGGSKPRTVEICDMGSCVKTWFHTEWSEQVMKIQYTPPHFEFLSPPYSHSSIIEA